MDAYRNRGSQQRVLPAEEGARVAEGDAAGYEFGVIRLTASGQARIVVVSSVMRRGRTVPPRAVRRTRGTRPRRRYSMTIWCAAEKSAPRFVQPGDVASSTTHCW